MIDIIPEGFVCILNNQMKKREYEIFRTVRDKRFSREI